MGGWVTDLGTAETLSSSMCFFEAWAALYFERISEEEYWRQVFAHLAGASHKPDEDEKEVRLLAHSHPFWYSVLDSAREMGPVEGEYGDRQCCHLSLELSSRKQNMLTG